MEDNKVKLLHGEFSLSNFSMLEDRDIKAKCRIAYAGKNRNYTEIPKEVFESALDSLIHVPVVGNWLGDNFGGHDIIMKTEGNEFIIKDSTEPIGFVPQDTEIVWEDVEDENGNVKKYLTCDVILWNSLRPEEVGFIVENGVNQSMEIMVNDYKWNDDDYLEILDFDFHALCVLGKDDEDQSKDVEPCFEDAGIAVEFSKEFNKEFNRIVSNYGKGDLKVKAKFEKQIEELTNTNVELEEKVAEFAQTNQKLNEIVEENNEKFVKLEEELITLREFKAVADKEKLENELNEVKAQFSTLLDDEAIEECFEEGMTPAELQTELALAYSKQQIEKANAKQEEKIDFVGFNDEDEDELCII